jgi:hypothetical protein
MSGWVRFVVKKTRKARSILGSSAGVPVPLVLRYFQAFPAGYGLVAPLLLHAYAFVPVVDASFACKMIAYFEVEDKATSLK